MQSSRRTHGALKYHSEQLATGALGPLMVKMSIPGMIGMIVMSVHNIVDTLWVSGLAGGTRAIAALTVLFPVQMTAGAVGMGIGVGLTSLVSRRLGEERMHDVHAGIGNALLLALFFGGSLTLTAAALAPRIAALFGAGPEIITYSTGYLRIVSAVFPFFMASLALDGFYRGSGNVMLPMLLTGLSSVLNAGLDPFLIYGLGPFPRMEVRGAALATAVSQMTATCASLAYLFSVRSGYRPKLGDFRPDAGILKEIARVGLPATAMNALQSLVGMVYNRVLAGFGPAALAAHGLSMRFMMLVISCLGGGVNQALIPIVGHSFGSGNYRRMWRAYRIAALWTSGGGLLLGGIVCLTAGYILAPFTQEAGVLALSVAALRFRMSTFFLVEPQMMAMFSLQGMGFGGRAMLLTVTRNVVMVLPGLLILPRLFGVYGAFAVQPAANVLGLFVTAVIMVNMYRRYPPGRAYAARNQLRVRNR